MLNIINGLVSLHKKKKKSSQTIADQKTKYGARGLVSSSTTILQPVPGSAVTAHTTQSARSWSAVVRAILAEGRQPVLQTRRTYIWEGGGRGEAATSEGRGKGVGRVGREKWVGGWRDRGGERARVISGRAEVAWRSSPCREKFTCADGVLVNGCTVLFVAASLAGAVAMAGAYFVTMCTECTTYRHGDISLWLGFLPRVTGLPVAFIMCRVVY